MNTESNRSAMDVALEVLRRELPPGDGRRALVAMSGGVDSSVAAALLIKLGYEVVGCFMRLGSPGETIDGLQPDPETCDPAKIKIGHQGCCSINDAADARLVAAQLGVPFYVCNFKKDFNRIIDYFVAEYDAGRTPNPCVRCNDWLKFGKLHEYARQIDAGFVASGHYARIDRTGPTPTLCRGVDSDKDQSYVLFGAPAERLDEMLLPVGALTKPLVRRIAEELDLPVFDKPDSQEICFVPDNDYAGLVERRSETARSRTAGGDIVDTDGNKVGTHAGQHRFTVGQRRGIGVALGYPLYVIEKSPAENTVTIGRRDALLCEAAECDEANWLADPADGPVLARYRYNGTAVPAVLRLTADGKPGPSGRPGRFRVHFNESQAAVAPGQAMVLYDAHDPDVVVGGGWIRQVTRRSGDASPKSR